MAEDKIIKVNKRSTRAKVDVSTFNREARTVEVTFATPTPVRTYYYEIGDYMEVLSCDPGHVDLVRMKNGAPALDSHDKYGSARKSVVGVVEDAWIADGECRARVRFSDASPDDIELMNKVADGIITGVSAGYDVFKYQMIRAIDDNSLPTYTAISWQPTEISFVAVQADLNSRVRSEGDTTHEVVVEDVTPEAEPAVDPVTEPEPEEDPESDNNNNENNNNMTEEEIQAAKKAERAAERARISGIRTHVRALKLPDTFADQLIEDDVDVATAGQRALVEWEKGNPLTPNHNADQPDAADRTRAAMANALVLRIDRNAATVMGAEQVRAAQEYRNMDLFGMASAALENAGVKGVRSMKKRDVATLALGGRVRGLHHTTDFPLLLMDTVNRTLLAQYQQQARTFERWARRTTISDFRPISRIRLTEIFGNLEEVKEGQEYKYATLSESGETYQLTKFGKIIGITWEAIINDDLSAFTRLPQAFAAKAAINQSNIVYNVILQNPAMADANLLFSAAHKNFTGTAGSLTAGGTAISEASLTLAYQTFSTQTDAAGDFITVMPKFLVVGPKNQFLAMKLTSANYTPNKQTDIPVGMLTGLEVIVDPRITNYEWFLIADPATIDTVEYAFLDGEEELFIEQREGFNIDGIEVKARMVFAAKAIDWRGMYRNNGAAPA